jgi:CreA protein
MIVSRSRDRAAEIRPRPHRWFGSGWRAAGTLVLTAGLAVPAGQAEEVGEVTTAIKILGANHKIVVEAFDDPKVEGVACFISRARTGGIKGSLGIAEDTSDAAVSCQQTGPIRFRDELEEGEQVYSARASILFKHVQVVRFHDTRRNALVYLTYSDKLVDGSPKNSISAVVIRDWQPAAPSSTPPAQ